jgi:TolB-like protein/Tfp pilus assembly protein PilF
LSTRHFPTSPVATELDVGLKRVLDSPLFKSSPGLARLLAYLAENTNFSREKRIKAYSIGVEVFDQPANFDPQSNALVRVQASRLREHLRRYYADEGRADEWQLSIPLGGYCVQLCPARREASANFGPRLAVLPFQNLSDDEQQTYLCDGITQEIMHLLVQSRALQLIAPDTMFHYRQRAAEPVGVGRELGVAYVLSGHIRIGGETVRVGAQLTDVRSNQQAWSESYERPRDPANILAIQDDIAQHIVALLSSPHGIIERLERRHASADFSAYAAVQRFYEYIEHLTPETHATARATLELAVQGAPDYAEAWACLSGAYSGEHLFGFNPRNDEPALDRALAAARRALQLAPDSVTGHYGLALTHYYRREMTSFRNAAERALVLAPNRTDLLSSLGMHLAYAGEWSRGLVMLDRARALNPLHPNWYWFPYAMDSYRRGDYAQALQYASQLNQQNFFWDHIFIAMICGQLGQIDQARPALERALRLCPALKTDAEAIIGIIHPDATMVALCLDGLHKAGM